jgi:putative nucleotidyltransferase with HDIG domain
LILYAIRFHTAMAQSLRQIVGVSLVVLVTLVLAMLMSRPPWDAGTIPLTFMAMVLAFAYNSPFALLLSFCMAIVMSISAGTGLNHMLILAGGLATAVLVMGTIRSRTRPVQVAGVAGVAFLSLTVATGMIDEQPTRLILFDGIRYFVWSVLAGFILSGSLPFVERCFGVMSDATLLELADGSHPLMQELVKRAPGTYTHSMTVATLAEAAAECIGANPLLVRVGSYFHDIGKMLKPHYFIENQTDENRHDNLEPALSTLVIVGHVKDGVALGEEYGLPTVLIDFIQQHHGTTLVEYFYREALRIQEEQGHDHCELEYNFRYPGPKPQTREASILMLADCVESASRALSTPNPNTLRKLVHEMSMKRLLDGQFDESGLTLTELRQIEESLSKSLIAVFHARIRYTKEEEERQVG